MELYEDFRQGYGDEAVQELAGYFRKVLADPHIHLGALWFKKSKADWIISKEGVRRIFEEFVTWAETVN